MRVAVFVGLLSVAGGSFGLLANHGLGDSMPRSADEAYGKLMAVVSSPFGGNGSSGQAALAAQQPVLNASSMHAFSCGMDFTPPPQSSTDAPVKVNCQHEVAPRVAPGTPSISPK